MKNAAAMINEAAGALVSLIKGLIVAAVFAGILFDTGLDPIGGISSLVGSFLSGGLLGLLSLLVLFAFMK